MNISKQVIILSAERVENTLETNKVNTDKLKASLKDAKIVFNDAVGVFNNGPEESSLVAIVENESEIQIVKDLAFKSFNQDAILHQDANQEAYLITPNNIKRLGRLEKVTQKEAFVKGSYTVLNGEYYATIPRV